MGKCIKSIVLSVIAAAFGILALSGPVFATPEPGNVNPDDTITVVDEPNDVTNPTNPEPADDEEPGEEDEESSKASCYDQVGSLGWIICPGAGLSGTIIDGAYDLLTQIIEVNPIPTDTDSPTYVVWEYFKDITNSIFIIFLLVIILSQLTGYGINNYGIKKALPRIVISAILVNLSYIICTIAVDLSNILGNSFQAFFENVQNIAIQNGNISDVASSTSVAGIVAAMLGIGAAGIFAGAVAYGSAAGIIWMLLPVLLSGIIAVVSAIITMAARQALIYLLVMVAPLALIAYMLPNTEKWFKKWYGMLAQMLFFYPMFSILYGASQLAGLVIITSATNWLGIVLGIAVKILPLFLSIPLMRMSNSVLGKISGLVNRVSAPAQGALGRYSISQQALAKQHQLNKRNPIMPSTRLAQYLDKKRAQREFDTVELAAFNKRKNLSAAKAGWYRRDGTLSKRGFTHLRNEQDLMRLNAADINIDSDFDEGFKADGTDKRVRVKDLGKLRAINAKYDDYIVDNATAESRRRVVAHNNMEHRAELIHEHVQKEGNAIHQRVLDSFNIDTAKYDSIKLKDDTYNAALSKQRKGQTLTAADQNALANGPLTAEEKAYLTTGSQAINYTLADAISSRRKLDKEATSVYYELYDDSPAGTIPGDALTAALENGDYSSMTAAIQVMAKRGDHKDIMDILRDNSKNIVEDDPNGAPDAKKIRIQKEINDACLSLKSDNQILWAWAKSNMIRRGKFNHAKAENPNEVPTLDAFIDFDSFINGSVNSDEERRRIFTSTGDFVNDSAKRDYDMISMENILTNVRDGKIFGDADRTMYNYFTKAAEKHKVDPEHYYFTATKHLRASASSGKMDGEQLASFNNFYTMNFSKDGKNNELFEANRGLVFKKLKEYFKDMNAAQLTGLKTATLQQFNDALIDLDAHMTDEDVNNGIYGKDTTEILDKANRGTTTVVIDGEARQVSNLLLNLLKGEITQLNQRSAINQRSGMNITVRKMLGIETEN